MYDAFQATKNTMFKNMNSASKVMGSANKKAFKALKSVDNKVHYLNFTLYTLL